MESFIHLRRRKVDNEQVQVAQNSEQEMLYSEQQRHTVSCEAAQGAKEEDSEQVKLNNEQ